MGANTAAATVGEALGAASDALRAAGVDTPRLDAEILLAEATGTGRAELVARPETPLTGAAARTFGQYVRRRVAREPVAYIIGRRGFRNIELEVDRRVLIPRPETEMLVEVAVRMRPATVLDIGTGSGALALAIADELPECLVVGTDTSPSALAVATGNRALLGLEERVELIAGTVPEGRSFDLTVTNLPYVATGEETDLQPELADHEPPEAFDAGPDGLDAYRAVIPLLRSPAVALEIGEGQAEGIRDLLRAAGYEDIGVFRDLAGIERVVTAGRHGQPHPSPFAEPLAEASADGVA